MVDSWGESRDMPPTYSFDKTRVTVDVNQLFLCLAADRVAVLNEYYQWIREAHCC